MFCIAAQRSVLSLEIDEQSDMLVPSQTPVMPSPAARQCLLRLGRKA
jgi:hypothetical protein